MVPPFRSIASRWRRPPAVYAEEETTRHATWMELFFDLVFVVAIAELGRHLHDNLAMTGLVTFAWLFLLVWWIWLAYNYYADIFDTEDTVSRVALVVVMFLMIFLSQTVDGVFHGNSLPFGVGLVALRGILTLLYLRERFEETDAGTFFTYWTGSEIITTLILVVALFVPVPGRFGLWLAAYVINTAGVFVLYLVFEPVIIQASHFPERLGLMTIIVLGETILAVAFGTTLVSPDGSIAFRFYLIGAVAFAVAVAMWWLYFERFDERFIDRILQIRDESWLQARENGLLYVFSHFPIHIGIVAIGVGITVAIDAEIHGHALSMLGLLVLCSGVVAFLVGITVCHRMLPRRIHDRLVFARVGGAGIVLAIPVVAPSLSPLAIVTTIALVLVGLVVLEGRGPPSDEVESQVDVGRTT
jgi:low temperature requirement protein LtrA